MTVLNVDVAGSVGPGPKGSAAAMENPVAEVDEECGGDSE
jgi:hypothetical protein